MEKVKSVKHRPFQARRSCIFQRIRIFRCDDFSKYQKHLAHVYPGSGGCAQTAGIKIQLEYDLHSGQFLKLSDRSRKKIMIRPLEQNA